MSALATPPPIAPDTPHTGVWPIETNRGVWGVTMVILTEGTLFVCLFGSYYFLGADKYRWTIERLEAIVGTKIKTIHVVGGGSKNALLCQLAANACACPVVAGPIEATAIGNILMQAIGRGRLGSIADLRTVVARSFPVAVFEPKDTAAWDEAAGRFEQLVKS